MKITTRVFAVLFLIAGFGLFIYPLQNAPWDFYTKGLQMATVNFENNLEMFEEVDYSVYLDENNLVRPEFHSAAKRMAAFDVMNDRQATWFRSKSLRAIEWSRWFLSLILAGFCFSLTKLLWCGSPKTPQILHVFFWLSVTAFILDFGATYPIFKGTIPASNQLSSISRDKFAMQIILTAAGFIRICLPFFVLWLFSRKRAIAYFNRSLPSETIA